MSFLLTENGDYLTTESGDRIMTEDTKDDELYAHASSHEIGQSKIWIPNIESEMIEYFSQFPQRMHSMPPRKFEELIASIFKNQGFSVSLTPEFKDGGFDVVAVQNDEYTGESRYLIECKRYSKDNKVGVGIVRSLYGVVVAEEATKGIIVTTSFFTRGAIEHSQQHLAKLSLSDYEAVTKWLKELKGP